MVKRLQVKKNLLKNQNSSQNSDTKELAVFELRCTRKRGKKTTTNLFLEAPLVRQADGELKKLRCIFDQWYMRSNLELTLGRVSYHIYQDTLLRIILQQYFGLCKIVRKYYMHIFSTNFQHKLLAQKTSKQQLLQLQLKNNFLLKHRFIHQLNLEINYSVLI